jgi:hypothetical protein
MASGTTAELAIGTYLEGRSGAPSFVLMRSVVHRGVHFDSGESGASDLQLAEAEAVLEVHLPPALSEFFRRVNGGECGHRLTLPDRMAPVCFAWWYALEEALGERAALESAHFRARLPGRFIPIAATGSEDDALLIDLSAPGIGNVLAWMSGRPPGWHRPSDDVLLALACTG